jgi:putrescine transport system permease protein
MGPPARSSKLPPGHKAMITAVFAWYLVFFLIPFALIVKISLAEVVDAVPPFSALFSWAGSTLMVRATGDNFLRLFSDPIFVEGYLGSLRIAATTTLLCIGLGYPLAYAVAAARPSARTGLLILITIPFWTSVLIRIYAWIAILKDRGLLNGLLEWSGVIHQPLHIMNSPVAVTIGMVYCYLPFFVLPLYAVIEKLDGTLLEAASDLGATGLRSFCAVTLPLSLPGVAAGAILVFVPATGEYLIPKLLGGAVNLMIAPVLWDSFFLARDWPIASAATVTLLLVVLLPLALLYRARSWFMEETA